MPSECAVRRLISDCQLDPSDLADQLRVWRRITIRLPGSEQTYTTTVVLPN